MNKKGRKGREGVVLIQYACSCRKALAVKRQEADGYKTVENMLAMIWFGRG